MITLERFFHCLHILFQLLRTVFFFRRKTVAYCTGAEEKKKE
jgi:hypothetical protein